MSKEERGFYLAEQARKNIIKAEMNGLPPPDDATEHLLKHQKQQLLVDAKTGMLV